MISIGQIAIVGILKKVKNTNMKRSTNKQQQKKTKDYW